ncbi:hypothetical protein [Marixanthomonas spongiae]|uniref:Uncharacterized protein n=1 Tax=Marixanthomonas spongiae TaxID=2174845 RepID=A0A2U0HS75_9FLAO|nr:hypothetical protein [Marixanthomonas spongiae]PVW11716.1 hypothetical protein DDV96_15575 [Marixanthomonas spongiae]
MLQLKMKPLKKRYIIFVFVCFISNSHAQTNEINKHDLEQLTEQIFKKHYKENYTAHQVRKSKSLLDSIFLHTNPSHSIEIKADYTTKAPSIKTVVSKDKKVRVVTAYPLNLPEIKVVQYSKNKEELFLFSDYVAQLKLEGEVRMQIDAIYNLSADTYLFSCTRFGFWTNPVDVHAFTVNLISGSFDSSTNMLFSEKLETFYPRFSPEIDTKPYFKIIFNKEDKILTTPIHKDGEIKGIHLYKYDNVKKEFTSLAIEEAPPKQKK